MVQIMINENARENQIIIFEKFISIEICHKLSSWKKKKINK